MHLSVAATLLCLQSTLAYVNIPTKGGRANAHPAGDKRFAARSDKTLQITLQNLVSFYQIELGVGTPVQKTVYTIDTGSSDLWIMSSENPYCTTDETSIDAGTGSNCTGEHSFDYSSSTSWTTNTTTKSSSGTLGGDYNFYIAYGDSSVAMGFWGNDVVQVGNATLKNCSVAVATVSNATTSVMGIGLRSTESTYNNPYTGTSYAYQNVPYMMKDQGVIQHVAYSMWLNDYSSSEGNILFGGIDHEKYVGSLGLVPMVKLYASETGLTSNDPVRTAVMLHGVGIVNNAGTQANIASCSFPVLLDSGSTANYLPAKIVAALGRSVGGTYYSDLGAYVYPCNTAGGVVFNFSGVKLTVPLSFLGLQITSTTGGTVKDSSGNQLCALAVLESSTSYIIGDAALRAAYVAYDLENYQIALGVANYDSKDSNIEEIVDHIPGAVSAPSYSSTSTSASISTTINTSLLSGATKNSFSTAVATYVNSMVTGGSVGSNQTQATGSSSKSSKDAAAHHQISLASVFMACAAAILQYV